jgi:hypothetical protein
MKAYVIFSSNEPALVVTRQTIRSAAVLDQLDQIGMLKFIAREVPISPLRGRYGRQFEIVEKALQNGCDLRVLDFSGPRIFQNLPFSEFGPTYSRESRPTAAATGSSSRASFRPNLRASSPALFG